LLGEEEGMWVVRRVMGTNKLTQIRLMVGFMVEDIPSMYYKRQHCKASVTYSE
jgi:hypothetical protein